MRFAWEGQDVTLEGNPSLQCFKVSLKTLVKTLRVGGNRVLVECNGLSDLETAAKTALHTPDFLTQILNNSPKLPLHFYTYPLINPKTMQ